MTEHRSPTPEEITQNAEEKGHDSDPFPPEGTTDEHLLSNDSQPPIRENERVRATRKALRRIRKPQRHI
ncbi:hypothetical protein [Asticcacaulis excentricus]|uniref:Uncharacterized protein n=1 Tax=Asticcacaulis excentricus (strain ATCC 15261 / DSM 4724 / KCTC 12464 / NCIMB 9791 / VKM B-1370 / CB 48) TaxID=573065 RepID=E8RTY7_ASTEC|nr:hypothetical protein [Asticcacaulis excentricus]ADU14958.1 hypothetical protein Astex_3324 [Asticcacaulis excentricus CB 48]